LTGALLVGDSVDYSLRELATMRLGGIRFALDYGSRFFSEELNAALRQWTGAHTAPALALRGMAISEQGEKTQVNQVHVLGIGPGFWRFAGDAEIQLAPYETALSERLAAALGVGAGDEIALRVARADFMSRDAPLSSREQGPSKRFQLTVRNVVSDERLGRFSLAAEQAAPRNAFVDLAWLQDEMELAGRANLLLVGRGATENELKVALARAWQPEHIGLRLRRHVSDVVQLESDRVFVDAPIAEAALGLPGASGVLSYLVNGIAKGERSTPYSFAVAGPAPGGMGDDEVLVNRWLADQIETRKGDRVGVAYYEVLPTNEFVERQRTFTVRGILEMDALHIERELSPPFPGLSDVEHCQDWQIGIPMDEDLLKDAPNEAYWDEFRQTPKIVVTLAAGQAMWANRFGSLTAVRFTGADVQEDAIRESLRQKLAPAELGLSFVPVHDQALEAVTQALDFGGLFLGMSFFLILSALVLTGLLFVFGVQNRAGEMGTLLALGFRPALVRRLFLGEALGIALLGGVCGAWAGALYTRALILGLARYWPGAVAHAAIQYHADPGTVMQGAAIGVACAVAAMAIAVWRQTRHTPRELLAMDFTQDQSAVPSSRSNALSLAIAAVALGFAAAIVAHVWRAGSADVAPPFFAAGALLLLSGLALSRYVLGRAGGGPSSGETTLLRFVLQNAARRRGRSLSVIGLLAGGCFLVLAVSSMQVDVTAHADRRESGTGGFEIFAQSTVPIVERPSDVFEEPDVEVVPIRVHDGDDASCLNLNHARAPRLLGVNVARLAALRAFLPAGNDDNLWRLLESDLPDGQVPALVGDSDTAMWGLKKKTGLDDGDVLLYQDEAGRDVRVKLVGRLPMRLSVFQGAVLVADDAFTRLYPSESGFRMFLMDAPPQEHRDLAARLNARLDRFGLDAVPAVDRLREFYAVESTYLAMFLILGGLGIVLGSAGLGIVILRNLLERRREVAMLRALGYRRQTLFRMLIAEHGLLLVAGIIVGGVAAAIAMAPAVTSSGTHVSGGLITGMLALVMLAGVSCTALALFVGLGKSDVAALRDE